MLKQFMLGQIHADIGYVDDYITLSSQYSYRIYDIIAPALICSVFFVFLSFVPLVLGLYNIFKKANEKPWKAFIPIYGIYTAFKILGNKKTFYTAFCSSLISSAFFLLNNIYFGLLASLVTIVCYIIFCSNISEAFSKKGKFAVGVCFLPFIFIPILGFGKNKFYKNFRNIDQDKKN